MILDQEFIEKDIDKKLQRDFDVEGQRLLEEHVLHKNFAFSDRDFCDDKAIYVDKNYI